MLAAESIVTFIPRLVCPSFYAIAMLKILFPLTFVQGSIYVVVSPSTIGLVICPMSFVNITVNMYEFAFAVSFVIPPFTFISSSVVPELLAEAISKAALPLACVDGA